MALVKSFPGPKFWEASLDCSAVRWSPQQHRHDGRRHVDGARELAAKAVFIRDPAARAEQESSSRPIAPALLAPLLPSCSGLRLCLHVRRRCAVDPGCSQLVARHTSCPLGCCSLPVQHRAATCSPSSRLRSPPSAAPDPACSPSPVATPSGALPSCPCPALDRRSTARAATLAAVATHARLDAHRVRPAPTPTTPAPAPHLTTSPTSPCLRASRLPQHNPPG